QDWLGSHYETADALAYRQDLVDQPGTLSPVQPGLVELPPLARREHRLAQRFSMPAELVGSAQPPLDEVIARDPRHRARPFIPHQDVADIGDDGVGAIAVEDRLLDRVVRRRLRGRQEARA